MKCLLVKPEFAQWIVQGAKHNEYRTLKTYVRGRIGIAETGVIHGGNWPMRRIVGDVEIYDCIFCPNGPWQTGTYTGIYAWRLRNPRRYKSPVYVPVQHGPQIFFKAEYDAPKMAIPPLFGAELIQAELDCIEAEKKFLAKLGRYKTTNREAPIE